MIRFYSGLQPKTAEELKKMLALSPDEQYRLNEELGLLRIFSAEVIRDWSHKKVMYEVAKADGTYSAESIAQLKAACLAAESLASQEFEKISRLSEKAASIEYKTQNNINANTFTMFMDVVLRLVYEVFADGTALMSEKLDHFENEVRNHLQFRKADTKSLQPVLENREMLESVPLVPEDKEDDFDAKLEAMREIVD